MKFQSTARCAPRTAAAGQCQVYNCPGQCDPQRREPATLQGRSRAVWVVPSLKLLPQKRSAAAWFVEELRLRLGVDPRLRIRTRRGRVNCLGESQWPGGLMNASCAVAIPRYQAAVRPITLLESRIAITTMALSLSSSLLIWAPSFKSSVRS